MTPHRHQRHAHPYTLTLPAAENLRETLTCLWFFLPEEARIDWLVHTLSPRERHTLQRHFDAKTQRA